MVVTLDDVLLQNPFLSHGAVAAGMRGTSFPSNRADIKLLWSCNQENCSCQWRQTPKLVMSICPVLIA